MTDLDEGITEFQKLVTLNLCGNYIENLDTKLIPPSIRTIELQANRIRSVEGFVEDLSQDLLYLGLARNLLKDGKKYVKFCTVVKNYTCYFMLYKILQIV